MIIDFDHFRARILQDALTEATAQYWIHRAYQFQQAAPGPDEFHGNATAEELRQRSVFLTSLSAYFFLETAIAIPDADRKRVAFSQVFAIWNREAYNAGLALLVHANEPSYFAPLTESPAENHSTTFDRVYEKWITVPLALSMAFLPFVFEIYAFIVLFAGFGITDWTVWLNLVITSILLVATTSVIATATSSPT